VSGLSSGDRQRVALGRAIVREPLAFLMDEPLGALDSEFRELMCQELRGLHDRLKATTVYVTHDQMEAMAMADTIAIMNNGVIEQLGAPQEVYDRPASVFVADFIGRPAMNFIPFSGAYARARARCGSAARRWPCRRSPKASRNARCCAACDRRTCASTRPRRCGPRWSAPSTSGTARSSR
jgi:multiple sugar transport system ATP-binding protein